MAYDKVIDSSVLDANLTSVANAIRSKGGTSASLAFPAGFVNAISAIKTGITPTGTKTITENGTHDVTNYATAQVNVPEPAQNFIVYPITLSSAYTGAVADHTILSGNEFVKAHYADEGFFAMWIPLNTPKAAESGTAGFIYHSNRAMLHTNSAVYAVFARSTSPTANSGWMPNTNKVSGSGYNVSFRANSKGNLIMYRSATYTIPAGEYRLVLGLVE